MSTKAEFETELAVIKARADYYDRPDLIARRTFLETELNRLNGVAPPGYILYILYIYTLLFLLLIHNI